MRPVKVKDLIEEVNRARIEVDIDSYKTLNSFTLSEVDRLLGSIDIINETIEKIKKLSDSLKLLKSVDINYTIDIDTSMWACGSRLIVENRYGVIRILIKDYSTIYKNMDLESENLLDELIFSLQTIKDKNLELIEMLNSNIVAIEKNA